ncbi:hypothetical protein PIB30_104260, partial [Stylosanthes scabra]|nr:hypothetical protein [Stylosanthes scabra]
MSLLLYLFARLKPDMLNSNYVLNYRSHSHAASQFLSEAFVPIWDVDEAWYMMILDVRKPRVYSLDVHKTVENMARKEKQMKVVLRALSLMFATPTHILNFTDRSLDTNGWGSILLASGIPEDLTSAKTAIWACSWLSQSGGFRRNIFGSMGDEDTLRMRLASSIVGACKPCYNMHA